MQWICFQVNIDKAFAFVTLLPQFGHVINMMMMMMMMKFSSLT
jgi:hypothetical protein